MNACTCVKCSQSLTYIVPFSIIQSKILIKEILNNIHCFCFVLIFALQRTQPQSYQVLLQLPPAQLRSVFAMSPGLRKPLLEHVNTFTEHQVKDSIIIVVFGHCINDVIKQNESQGVHYNNLVVFLCIRHVLTFKNASFSKPHENWFVCSRDTSS